MQVEALGPSLDHTFVPGSTAPIRVLAFIEASWVTGPAKNLIEFASITANSTHRRLQATIVIVTYHRGSSPATNDFIHTCERAGLAVHVIHERCAFDLAVIPQFRQVIAEWNPHIVQTHSLKSHFLMRLTAMHKHSTWIAFHHGYTWTNTKVGLYNQLDRWSLPAAARVVTTCHPFAASLAHAGVPAGRIKVRHNSVRAVSITNEETVELRRSLGIPSSARVLLTVGRLSKEKGQIDLIEALSRVRRTSAESELYLVVVGDGPEGGRLRSAAKKNHVADRVVFAGHQKDVRAYYAMADMMILPSHTEGSPNALLEAMTAGLPIVATRVGGIPEIVANEVEALLVEKENPQALAQAITRLLCDKGLSDQLSRAARQSAANHSAEEYSDFMLSLYKECVSMAPARRREADPLKPNPIV